MDMVMAPLAVRGLRRPVDSGDRGDPNLRLELGRGRRIREKIFQALPLPGNCGRWNVCTTK
jgi:hypothetical protein